MTNVIELYVRMFVGYITAESDAFVYTCTAHWSQLFLPVHVFISNRFIRDQSPQVNRFSSPFKLTLLLDFF